jgi:hypothetical protein
MLVVPHVIVPVRYQCVVETDGLLALDSDVIIYSLGSVDTVRTVDHSW